MYTDISPNFSDRSAAPRRLRTFLDRALDPAEAMLILLTVALGILCFVLSYIFGQPVAWQAFLISFAPACGLLVLGGYIRLYKDMQRTASCAIAAAIYIGFSGVAAILIYLRFPIAGTIYDAQLMQIDRVMTGYSWPAMVHWLAQFPLAGKALALVYGSSLPQLFVVIFALSFMGRLVALHRILLTGTISLLFAIAIWWCFPTFGPAPYFQIPAEVEAAVALVYDNDTASRLLDMAAYGNALIAPGIIMGTIASPSYHTIMACMVVWFLARSPLFWPALVLNLVMVPAILSHGGHHVIDVIAGVAVFFAALWIAQRLVPNPQNEGLSGQS